MDAVPLIVPKSTRIFELPEEGFVGLEWIKAVMENKKTVEGLLPRESGFSANSGNGYHRGKLQTQKKMETRNKLVQKYLELSKDHKGFDDLIDKLDMHFPQNGKADEICDGLRALLRALCPKRNFKVGYTSNLL